MSSMDDDIKLGVLIPIGQAQWGPEDDPRSLVGFAVRAEELGYSSLWVNDFLLTPRIEALTMLASIDLLSGGRLVLTVGAAFPGQFGVPQHALSEVPWERRFTRWTRPSPCGARSGLGLRRSAVSCCTSRTCRR
jgi:alkanesulfonate monooxygenase SsuD/methylene tetrahydromethanopterin reductase-like flavin-dependent oxidoreductase (luciferase family)